MNTEEILNAIVEELQHRVEVCQIRQKAEAPYSDRRTEWAYRELEAKEILEIISATRRTILMEMLEEG